MRLKGAGLLGPIGRENSRQLAKDASHNGPFGLRNLLSRSRADPGELWDDAQEYVAQRLGASDVVPDRGRHRIHQEGRLLPRVQRQCSGTAGRTETPSGSAPSQPR